MTTHTVDQIAANLRHALQAGAEPAFVLDQARQQLSARSVEEWIAVGRAFIDVGLVQQACVLLEEAGRRWPGRIDVRCWFGNALRAAKHGAAAEAVLRSALKSAPDYEPAAVSLAFMLRDQGRLNAACDVVTALLRQQGGSAESTLRCGEFLEECQRYAESAEVYEAAIARGATHPMILFGAGDASIVLGRFDRARQYLEAAIRNGLNLEEWSGVWLLMANLQRYSTPQHPDFAVFEKVLGDTGRSPTARAPAGFALGKALGDVEDYAGAVAALRKANELERARRPWSESTWKQFVDRRIASPNPPSARRNSPDDQFIPVFVVGLPRTGTTLVAERLSAYPAVKNRGELNWIPFLHQELANANQLDDPDALCRAASIYRAQVRQDDTPARFYIDKNPLNFRHLGMIASMFPQARIIHCDRERRDTALSIWSLHFAHNDIAFSYSLESIAAFSRGHDLLMNHWRQSLDLPIFSVRYEDLVYQTDEVMKALAGFIGLPAEGGAESASKSDSSIATASVWQARQPVYTRSAGRWRSYAPHLPELLRSFPDSG